MKFQTPYNYDYKEHPGEVNNSASKTIPDQSMTVQEIMRRFASGLPLGGGKTPVWYGEDNDLPDLERLDLAERQEVMEQLQAEYRDIKRKQREAERARLKAENEAKNKQKQEAAPPATPPSTNNP